MTIGKGVRTIPAPFGTALWLPTNDGSAALAAVNDELQRPWALRHGAWRPVGDQARWFGGYGCVSAGAQHWINDGKSIKSTDRMTPYDVEGEISNCAFTSDGVVVTSYVQRFEDGMPTHSETRVTLLDLNGTVRAMKTFGDQEMWLATDVNANHFVLVGGGRALVFDGGGNVIETIPGASSALFDEEGNLVTVDPQGEVTWRTI